MWPNWRPYAIAGLLGVTIQNSTFLLRAFGFYVHTVPGHVPKEQRHFVTADLLEATAHKQCCPRNSAILLWAFLSCHCTPGVDMRPNWRPYAIAGLLGVTIQNSTFLLRAFGFYVHTVPGHVPKEQRHFVTADLFEATAHKQCRPRNSAILLRAFLSSHCTTGVDMRPNWRPYAIADSLGVTIQRLLVTGFWLLCAYRTGACAQRTAPF